MEYKLKELASPEDWKSFHEIREKSLFLERGKIGIYQQDHPDERNPQNHPLIFLLDGKPIGVLRLDELEDGIIGLRRVAIIKEQRNKGHGSVMIKLVEEYAFNKLNANKIISNVDSGALNFYLKHGYSERAEDIHSEAIPMEKIIGIN